MINKHYSLAILVAMLSNSLLFYSFFTPVTLLASSISKQKGVSNPNFSKSSKKDSLGATQNQLKNLFNELLKAIKNYPNTEEETIKDYQTKIVSKVQPVIQYLITRKNFPTTHVQTSVVKKTMEKLKEDLISLLEEDSTHLPAIAKAFFTINQEILLYTLDIQHNILANSWGEQSGILENKLIEKGAIQQTSDIKDNKTINLLVGSIQKDTDYYLENFQHSYLVNENEAYKKEVLEEEKYYQNIAHLLRVSLEKRPINLQKKIIDQLYYSWKKKKDKVIMTQKGWQQFDQLCKLHYVLSAYYYTSEEIFAEQVAAGSSLVSHTWLTTPPLFWQEKILPLAIHQMKDLETKIEEDSLEAYWRSSDAKTIQEDQLFLQTAMQVGIRMRQNVEKMNLLYQKFTSKIAALEKLAKQKERAKVNEITNQLKNQIEQLFNGCDYLLPSDISVKHIAHSLRYIKKRRSVILKKIKIIGKQLYPLIMTMGEKTTQESIHHILEYIKEQVAQEGTATQLERFDKVSRLAATLQASQVTNSSGSPWESAFSSLESHYKKETQKIIQTLIDKFRNSYNPSSKEQKKNMELVFVALLSSTRLDSIKGELKDILQKMIHSQFIYLSPEEFPDTSPVNSLGFNQTFSSQEKQIKQERVSSSLLSKPNTTYHAHKLPSGGNSEAGFRRDTTQKNNKEKRLANQPIVSQKENEGLRKLLEDGVEKPKKKVIYKQSNKKINPPKVSQTNKQTTHQSDLSSLFLSSTLMTLGMLGWVYTAFHTKKKQKHHS